MTRGTAGTAAVAGALLVCAWSPGLEVDQWWPALALLVVVLCLYAAIRPAVPLAAGARVALAAAVAWTGWSALSILWAQDRGWAVEATGRAALVTTALALVLWWPSRGRLAGRTAAAGLVLAAVLVGIVAWGQTLDGLVLEDGRLRGNLPYANAFALLMIAGALVALGPALTARRPAMRGGAAALVVVLLASAAAAQSRSSPAALAVGLLVFVALFRPRWPELVTGAGMVLGLVACLPTVLDLRRVMLTGVDTAQATLETLALVGLGAILAAAVAAAIAVLVARRADAAGEDPVRATPVWRRLALAGAAAMALAPAGITILSHAEYDRVESASTRFAAGGGSNRPDMWRVAVSTTADHPVLGIGAGSFERPYLRLRRTDVAPRFAHGLPAEAASTLGLPGLMLILAFCGGLIAAATDARRRWRAQEAALAAAGAAILAHALVDWTFEVPLIALAAVLALGVLQGAPEGAGAPEPGWRRRAGIAPRLVAVTAALLTVALLPVALAATLARSPAGPPPDRIDQFERAARLARLDVRPLQSLALAQLEAGNAQAGLRAARAAVTRGPHDWLSLWLAAQLERQAGDPTKAPALLARATAAAPREPVLQMSHALRERGAAGLLAAVRQVTGTQPPRPR